MPRLLEQVRAVIRLKHYSIRTEEAYAHWIKEYILFHRKRHPLELGPEHGSRFLSFLADPINKAGSCHSLRHSFATYLLTQ